MNPTLRYQFIAAFILLLIIFLPYISKSLNQTALDNSLEIVSSPKIIKPSQLPYSKEIIKKLEEGKLTFGELRQEIERKKAAKKIDASQDAQITADGISKAISTSSKIIGQVLAQIDDGGDDDETGKVPADYDGTETELHVLAYDGDEDLGQQCGLMTDDEDNVGSCWEDVYCGGAPENCMASSFCTGSCKTDESCYYTGFCIQGRNCYEPSCYGLCGAAADIAYLWDEIDGTCCCGL